MQGALTLTEKTEIQSTGFRLSPYLLLGNTILTYLICGSNITIVPHKSVKQIRRYK